MFDKAIKALKRIPSRPKCSFCRRLYFAMYKNKYLCEDHFLEQKGIDPKALED